MNNLTVNEAAKALLQQSMCIMSYSPKKKKK